MRSRACVKHLVVESFRRLILRCSGGKKVMEQARESAQRVADAVCDGLKQFGDISYAMMPKDIAHALADLKKAFLSQIRSAVDWEIEWIDERVAGGDKLREEWKANCEHQSSSEPTA
jgi:hypothetical protein